MLVKASGRSWWHVAGTLLLLTLTARCARVSTPTPFDGLVRGRDAGPDAPPRDRGGMDGPGSDATAPPTCDCPLGCNDAGCPELVPANGFAWGPLQSLPPLTGTYNVNTSTCSGAYSTGEFRAGVIAGGACVFTLDRLVVPVGTVLRATGARPLVLLIRGDVRVEGVIEVGARLDVPGPGGGTPGEGTGPGGGGGCCLGGGGGGFGSLGGYAQGTGGATYGNEALEPLVAGSGGGPGGQGRGGAGGGALQLSCGQMLRLDGSISAGGGGGAGAPGSSSGGGGGGSGGAVLLEAMRIVGAGVVATNGGGGGGVGGANGEDGGPGFAPAASGSPGGAGATGTTPAASGSPGGGGGGGVGRVRFNLPGPTATPPLATSASFSVGVVRLKR